MYEAEDKKREIYTEAVKNGDKNEALKYLFDTYYRLTLIHLIKTFKNVRHPILEDAAIESVEDWYFRGIHVWDYNHLNLIEQNAMQKIFKLVASPRNKKDSIDDQLINYLDELKKFEITDVDKDTDLAKVTFELKRKADKYIGELSDEDYQIITMFLEGRRPVYIRKKLGFRPKQEHQKITTAFNRLRLLIFGNPEFDRQKEIYRKNKHLTTFPEIMEMYYEKEMKQSEIANKLLVGVRLIEDRLRRQKKKLGIT